ncbi:MAG: 4-(cytidine 5'-diphospho)-2-C-methyl-D-erythritol kinase [Acutalibacteraceae bacterium]
MHLTVLAPAKLNLFLEILGKRNDNYHIINSIMQTVSLFDEVTVWNENNKKISVSCTDDTIPCDNSNTAYKAAEIFFADTGIENKGIGIKIKKRIPSQAGMAGGSSDAAAVLVALNEMFHTEKTIDELADMAEQVGADVPFCLYGGTMNASGIGTILSPLPDLPECYFLVVKPNINISTKAAYEKADDLGYNDCEDVENMAESICNGSLKSIGKHIYNKFETVIAIDEIENIKQFMLENGAMGAAMTGSGSAVFGLFENKDEADDCFKILEQEFEEIYILTPTAEGCKII